MNSAWVLTLIEIAALTGSLCIGLSGRPFAAYLLAAAYGVLAYIDGYLRGLNLIPGIF